MMNAGGDAGNSFLKVLGSSSEMRELDIVQTVYTALQCFRGVQEVLNVPNAPFQCVFVSI